MPHSLRVRLKNLQRKGELTEKDIDRIFKALSQEPCDDAISRDAVIEKVNDALDEWDGGFNKFRAALVENAINELPSVTQKLGKWDVSCTCSVCGNWRILESEKNSGKYKYCPNCGAKMESEV